MWPKGKILGWDYDLKKTNRSVLKFHQYERKMTHPVLDKKVGGCRFRCVSKIYIKKIKIKPPSTTKGFRIKTVYKSITKSKLSHTVTFPPRKKYNFHALNKFLSLKDTYKTIQNFAHLEITQSSSANRYSLNLHFYFDDLQSITEVLWQQQNIWKAFGITNKSL